MSKSEIKNTEQRYRTYLLCCKGLKIETLTLSLFGLTLRVLGKKERRTMYHFRELDSAYRMRNQQEVCFSLKGMGVEGFEQFRYRKFLVPF